MTDARIDQDSDDIKGILLWGGKSKARILNEMIKESGLGAATLIYDSTLTEPSFPTTAFFTNDIQQLKYRLHQVSHYVVCIGGEHGFARFKTAECLEQIGLQPLTLIHSRAFIESTSDVGVGCQIMPAAVIHKFCKLGKHTIINTNATVDHECAIGDGVHVMGRAAIAGKIVIDDYATIGTNATILPFLKIGKGAFVGAGAVVTKDVAPYSVVAGVPATILRETVPKFAEKNLQMLIAK